MFSWSKFHFYSFMPSLFIFLSPSMLCLWDLFRSLSSLEGKTKRHYEISTQNCQECAVHVDDLVESYTSGPSFKQWTA